MSAVFGALVRMLLKTTEVVVDAWFPQGEEPLAAKCRTDPKLNKSVAGVSLPPSICSGDNHAGVPATEPVMVKLVESISCAIPKSIIFGPVSEITMLPGFMSL